MDKYTMGFKFRIYPNHAQQELINRTLGCCRFVFNHFLAIRRDEWTANHKSVTYNQTSAMLTDLKRYEEYSWLKARISSNTKQNTHASNPSITIASPTAPGIRAKASVS